MYIYLIYRNGILMLETAIKIETVHCEQRKERVDF